jgi:hypothetical protein
VAGYLRDAAISWVKGCDAFYAYVRNNFLQVLIVSPNSSIMIWMLGVMTILLRKAVVTVGSCGVQLCVAWAKGKIGHMTLC